MRIAITKDNYVFPFDMYFNPSASSIPYFSEVVESTEEYQVLGRNQKGEPSVDMLIKRDGATSDTFTLTWTVSSRFTNSPGELDIWISAIKGTGGFDFNWNTSPVRLYVSDGYVIGDYDTYDSLTRQLLDAIAMLVVSAQDSEYNAAKSAAAARVSETNSANSAAAAKTSETNSANSAAAAKTSENNIEISLNKLDTKIDAVDLKLDTKIDAVDLKLDTKIDATNAVNAVQDVLIQNLFDRVNRIRDPTEKTKVASANSVRLAKEEAIAAIPETYDAANITQSAIAGEDGKPISVNGALGTLNLAE